MANIVNQYGQVKLGVRYALAPLTSSYLLDTYSGAAAAYSLRKLRTAYSGPAIRVRRSSDDTTLDVGFKADGTLDTTALLSFVGAGNGFVSIWYDQSTNGKNATQPASVNQPYIVVSGTLQTLNGKPSLFFNGESRYLDCGYLNGGTKPADFSTFISANFTAVNQTRNIFSSMDAGGNGKDTYNTFGIHSATPTPYQMFGGAGGGVYYKYWRTSNVPTQSLPYLFEQHYKSHISPFMGKFYWNNTLQTVYDWLAGTASQSTGPEFKTSIGRSGENNGGYHQGYVQEIATYFSDQTTNRSGITTNINSHYSIYAADVDAQAFITAASITDTTQQSAINTLVTDLKAANIWTKMKALYPFVGGNATAHSYNLINVANYQLMFMGGGTHTSLGYVGNGTTGYAKTGIIPNNVFTQNNIHVSYYSQTDAARAADDIGVYQASRAGIQVYMRYGSTNSLAYLNSSLGSFTVSTGRRYLVASRQSSSAVSVTNNGTTSSISSNSNANLATIEVYIHSLNLNGAPSGYSNRTSSTITFGQTLTNAEAQTLSTIVNTFNTTLGRNVY